MKNAWNCCTILLAFLVVGCGDSNLHPVNGKVVYEDGSPATAGMVIMELIEEGEGKRFSANGAIQPDGSFQIGTRRAEDGAPAGRYRVAVVSPPLSDEQIGKGEKPLVDARFSDHSKSGLEIEVKPGGTTATLTVSRPGNKPQKK